MPRSLLVVVMAIVLWSSPSFGQGQISTPTCIGWCPAGDHPFEMLNWTQDGLPVNGGLVFVVVESPFPNFRFCSTDSACFSTRTDSTGRAVLKIKAGGVVVQYTVKVWVWTPGSPGGRAVRVFDGGASFDLNGDLKVDALDLAIISSMEGQSGHTADFDCDSIVTYRDIDLLRQHLGHSCDGVTVTKTTSWGSLKQLYRGSP